MSTDPHGPFGAEDDPLAAFGSEAPSCAPVASPPPEAAVAAASLRQAPFDQVTFLAQTDPNDVQPRALSSSPPEAGGESVGAAYRFGARVVASLAASIVLGVVIGVSLVQIRRPQHSVPNSAAPAARDGAIEIKPQLLGTAGSGDAGGAKTTDSKPVPRGTARRNERAIPETVQVRDRHAARFAAAPSAPEKESPAAASSMVAAPVAPTVSLEALPSIPIPPADVSRVLAATPVPVATAGRDRDAIEDVVNAYRAYCERLDAVSAATLWRGVDSRALTRAFSTLSSQKLAFDRCDIDVAGVRATAVCTGRLSYVRRVGDQTPQSRRLSWSFDLERTAERWMISSVSAR